MYAYVYACVYVCALVGIMHVCVHIHWRSEVNLERYSSGTINCFLDSFSLFWVCQFV